VLESKNGPLYVKQPYPDQNAAGLNMLQAIVRHESLSNFLSLFRDAFSASFPAAAGPV
jgi:hypothetical protein